MIHFWYAAEWVASLVILAWVNSGFMLRFGLTAPRVRFVYHELRPWYWPAVVLGYLCEVVRWHQPFDSLNLMALGVHAVSWFLFKDAGGDDDDRWKRRRRRLVERVSEFGGRLTAVPAEEVQS
jgi:hypothetical protein